MLLTAILTSSIGPGGTRFSAPAPRGPVTEDGAVTVGRDRSAVAAGARSAARVAGLARGAKTAEAGGALVAAAAAAFADIRTRLTEMRQIAAQAASVKLESTDPTPAETSRVERAILHESFARLRAGIDDIASGTVHDGIAILAGGAGGGSLDLVYSVGADGASADSIAVSVDPGSVAELDASLASADLFTVASATAALADVNSAIESVDGARAALAAGAVRLQGAAAAAETRAASEAAAVRDRLATRVTVDVVRKVAGEVADERGVDQVSRATEAVRALLDIFEFSEPSTAAEDPSGRTAPGAGAESGVGQDGRAGASGYGAKAEKPHAGGPGGARGTRVDVAA